jgi:hypothetical protein
MLHRLPQNSRKGFFVKKVRDGNLLIPMVGPAGFEPATNGL